MTKFVKSFSWAINGIRTVWKEEINFRIEVGIAALVLLLALYVGVTSTEWMLIVGCIGAVLSAEMLNTAIEDLCNKVEPSIDPVIGKIKDIAGGFVLLVSGTSVIVGLVIFSHYV